MRLAIVGSRAYRNKERIEKIVEKYISQYTAANLTIISGGAQGADALAREIALEKGIHYEEYPPAHSQHNQYCTYPSDQYNKPYHVRNFFDRNTHIAETCDHLVAFVVKDLKANGTMDTVGKAHRLKKQVFVYEDE
jgi:predicted Rossmann fold nucleotide-binding protein DprA/Smf involved in DNA uptake